MARPPTSFSRSGYPRLPLPPAVTGSEIGSFAHYTLRERLPAILKQVCTDNALPPIALSNLTTLGQEVQSGIIRPIQDDGGADISAWATYLEPFQGRCWFDLPFFVAEAYFYRRILEAILYFQPGSQERLDPFARQKHMSLETAATAIRAIARSLAPASQNQTWQHSDLIRLLYLSLWGNRVDLSLWSAAEPSRIRTDMDQDEDHILINHSAAIADQLSQLNQGRVDVIVDNAGFELVCDLVLVDFLLSTRIAETVYLHLKPYPLFVSDAMIPDVHQTLTVLAADADGAVRSLATRLQTWITTQGLCLQDDGFWVAPLPFWDMPPALSQELAQSHLVLIKGDANYRRLLGDCHWEFTTPLEDIASYFPASFVALRTLKSEVAAGLQTEQLESLTQTDPNWLINGQWGVIHHI